ncbi:hypothetical protein D3C72_1714800 [compost metagenome]
MRNVVQEIGGAVERVDIPGGDALGLAPGLFGHDAELGRAGPQLLNNDGLGFAVRLGHEIVARLAVDHEIGAMVRVGLQNGGACMGCGDGRVDRGAQVDGRGQRLGLIVGIHETSVSPCMRQTRGKGQNPPRRVASIQRESARGPIIRACPNSVFPGPHVFDLPFPDSCRG